MLDRLWRASSLAATLLLVSAAAANDTPDLGDDVEVAVLAYDRVDVVERQLQPFVDTLEARFPEVDIRVAVLSHEQLALGVEARRFDVVLTDPYHYLRLREKNRLALAFGTVFRHSAQGDIASLGGTIVALRDRDDVQELDDLRGARVAIEHEYSYAGYVLPLAELRREDISRADIQWQETGSQRAALESLVAGEADAAFLRSGLLEALVARGEIAEQQLKVLNRQALADYPFAVSTSLAPEWPMIYLGSGDDSVMLRLLGHALVSPESFGVSDAGAIGGIELAADYRGTENLLRELALPPFDRPPAVTLGDIWRAHRLGVSALTLAGLVIAGLLLALWERNRRLRLVWEELREAHQAKEVDRRRLADLNRHFEVFLNRTTDFIYFKDAAGRFIFVSDAMARLTGHEDRHELEGKTAAELFPAPIASQYELQEAEVLRTGEPLEDQRRAYQRLEGDTGWISTYQWPVLSPDGERVLGLFAISRDVTALHDHEQALEQAAHYDTLTGLPNRNLLADRLQQAMASADRRVTEVAVVYMDLDGFKAVNDNHGHAMGDELLKQVARTMLKRLRRSDTVARLGGDEFVVLLADLNSRKECVVLVERLLAAVGQPYAVGAHQLEVTASAGVSFYSAGMDMAADQLLRQADEAMYLAKQAGRNRYRINDEQQDGELRAMLERVSQAIENEEFELFYQPVVHMGEGRVLGVEALVRWRQADGEYLLPDDFLPHIGDHPLAMKLEYWVLREALEQQRRWQDEGLQLRVQVNVSAADVSQPEFVSKLEVLLTETVGLHADCLTLEILESAAVADPQTANRVIDECRKLGVRFALDDFGTGYSSLSHIKDLRADSVKIDRRFVQSMYTSYDDFSILAAIVAMARAFDRDVVAEGVETHEQGAMLLRLGCAIGQGYAIAKPLSAQDFNVWLKNWSAPQCWSVQEGDAVTVSPERWAADREAWLTQSAESVGLLG